MDDDPISMEILSLMLGSDGHQVLRASDGEAALRLLGLAPGGASAGGAQSDVLRPDVLLIDMHMPGLSGECLAQQVRALAGPRPKLLAMSATVMEGGEPRGFDGFLQKPLTMEDLRQGMRTAGARSRRPQPSKRKAKIPLDRAEARMSENGGKPSVDQAVLGKLAQAMPAAALRELYAACIADSRTHAAILEELARAGKQAQLPPEAHRIKGAALMVGASRVAQIALSLERGSCNKEAALCLVGELQLALDDLERMLLAGKLEKENQDCDS